MFFEFISHFINSKTFLTSRHKDAPEQAVTKGHIITKLLHPVRQPAENDMDQLLPQKTISHHNFYMMADCFESI